jgi:hypothetical protein
MKLALGRKSLNPYFWNPLLHMYKISAFLFFLSLSAIAQQSESSLQGQRVLIHTIENPTLEEISGLAFSKNHPERIYVHTDSGGEAVIYVLDSVGNEIGEITLEGVENRDWEDIAVGPGPVGKSYIYVAEIGDNLGVHKSVHIFRFTEPEDLSMKIRLKPEVLTFTYPEGARDAESLFVDPVSGDLFVISKRDRQNVLFRLLSADFGKDYVVAEPLTKFTFTSTTAADISQDGSQILIKNYFKVYYWERHDGQSVAEALAQVPKEMPYVPEPQGEAIGFRPDGTAFYTISEKRFDIKPTLYLYPLNQ